MRQAIATGRRIRARRRVHTTAPSCALCRFRPPTRTGRTARALRKDGRDGLGLIWREAPRADVVEQVGIGEGAIL